MDEAEPSAMLFGEMAMKMRLISPAQLERGLQLQNRSRTGDKNRSLGACLHDDGILNLVEIQRIMDALGFPPERGRLLPDIEFSHLLGRGTSGAVYKGFSFTLETEVAVKVRAPRGPHSDPEGHRFHQEAKLSKRLNHPNIVRMYDAGETRDFTYHVFEYIDGHPLDKLIKTQGKLASDVVIDIAIQLASALTHATKNAIVHRDIKPANILMATDGSAKLCDLGLAKDMDSQSQLTATGMVLGSPYYIAPEYASQGKVDARSDIYSLGVTLFHCASGDVPFRGKGVIEILNRVVKTPTPHLLDVAANVAPGLDEIVYHMMHKNPHKRYQSAAQLHEALLVLKETGTAPLPSMPASMLGRLKGWFGLPKGGG